MTETRWLAHVRPDEQGKWIRHELIDHLEGVAEMASRFGDEFGAGPWAEIAGRVHDMGKFRPAFQNMIKVKSGYDPEAHLEGQPGRVDHSTAGGILAEKQLGLRGRILAYLVAGHHTGLPDWSGGLRGLEQRLTQNSLLDEALQAGASAGLCPKEPPPIPPGLDYALWIRLLFSCLVDADFLDTEAFMNPGQAEVRGRYPALKEMWPPLENHLDRLTADAPDSEVNRIRKEVLDRCLARAVDSPGLFSLTVPTGGGKTLSSLAFALKHAVRHKLNRIIYVIPYTSIIEQTSTVFRNIFGDAVIEHHSSLEPIKETIKNRLASENWDGPLIVTTAVQFFESLFAARPGRCRKLHNIVGSVVILDEAQLLPPDLLRPILHVLDQLRTHYRVSPVLCTATQPALDGMKGFDFELQGLDKRREIMESPTQLHRRLKRVSIELPPDFNTPLEWDRLAQKIKGCDQILAVVNTRNQARELFGLLERKGSFHLSAQMCGQHRSEKIDEIKARLEAGETCRVVSTQLIECGVDLDFPVVYRALAGLDSMAQAAGRCNREGRLSKGLVQIFVPPGKPPPGHLTQAVDAAREILEDRPQDPLAPENFEVFFQHLYWSKGQEGLDRHEIMTLLEPTKDARFSFRTAAAKFRMIEDKDRRSVVVQYGQGRELIEELRRAGPSRELFSQCQRYVVDIPQYAAKPMLDQGDLEDVEGVLVQNSSLIYDPHTGLVTEGPSGEAFFS